jgi:hypothetical protein
MAGLQGHNRKSNDVEAKYLYQLRTNSKEIGNRNHSNRLYRERPPLSLTLSPRTAKEKK